MRLRPHLTHFLESCKSLFHMTIYTHGTRSYAEATAALIDPTGIYFGKRIVSRTDHPELGLEKCLSRLFLEDWSMAVVLDDRDDVWKKNQQSHVVCIRPYLFFHQFAARAKPNEVNNAPGLSSIESLLKKPPSHPDPSVHIPADEKAVTQEIPPPITIDQSVEIPKSDGIVEDDNSLLQSLETLKSVHSKYFELFDQGEMIPNVGTILTTTRRSVLRGCHISFSGLLPPNLPNLDSHRLLVMAKSLGATVSLQLSPRTTHLLTISLETEKSRESMKLGNIYLCHPDWLLACHWHIKREDETPFLLTPITARPHIDIEEVQENLEEIKSPTTSNSSLIKRPLHRSDAGEFGVNYNSESESEESSDSDSSLNRPKKMQRLMKTDGEDKSDSSESGEDDWINGLEQELAQNSPERKWQEDDDEESEEDLGCRCETWYGE